MLYKDKKKTAFKSANTSTVDEGEIRRFNQLAEEWWKPHGKFKVVHAFNAARIEKLTQELPKLVFHAAKGQSQLSGISLLDVGCGAGIVSEPMAALGADVTAIDASERNIMVAKLHAEKAGVAINYRHLLPEDIAATGQTFDIVMSLEVIEHVAAQATFLELLASLVKPGGILVIGTINRTAISYVKAIIGAEYVMRWLPMGTHNWKKFVKPEELDAVLIPAGYETKLSCGIDYRFLDKTWKTTNDTRSIYLRIYKHSEPR